MLINILILILLCFCLLEYKKCEGFNKTERKTLIRNCVNGKCTTEKSEYSSGDSNSSSISSSSSSIKNCVNGECTTEKSEYNSGDSNSSSISSIKNCINGECTTEKSEYNSGDSSSISSSSCTSNIPQDIIIGVIIFIWVALFVCLLVE